MSNFWGAVQLHSLSFLRKKRKTRAGKHGSGRTGKRTHEAESGKGERTRSAGTPEMKNGDWSRGERPDAGMEHQARNAGSATA